MADGHISLDPVSRFVTLPELVPNPSYQKILGMDDSAEATWLEVNRMDGRGFVTEGQPTFAIWFYKVLRDNRCDVLGNSLAILTGLADREKAHERVAWMEARCGEMRMSGELSQEPPPFSSLRSGPAAGSEAARKMQFPSNHSFGEVLI